MKGLASSALAKLPDLTSLTTSPLATKAAIVMGSLLFVIVVYLLVRSGPDRYYSKAVKFHKLGERKYLCGDHEGAEVAYSKAEGLRKRARELQ